MKNRKFIFWVLIPALIHVAIFMLIPIIGGIVISFMDYNPMRDTNFWIGFDNFRALLDDPLFRKALINTLVFVFVTVTLNIVGSLAIAQLISYFRSNKTRGFFRMIFFSTLCRASCRI